MALLSASAQLRLLEDSRRQQGHHRLSSAQLYSRDDTIESIWVQSQVASALIRGWRPTRPQSRGGQHPVFEPAFSVGDPQASLCTHCPPSSKCSSTNVNSRPSLASWTQRHGQSRMLHHRMIQTPRNPEGQAHATLPASSSSAICLVQITTGAAVHAVYSSHESVFCTACSLGIHAPTRCIDYLGQEHLCNASTSFHSCHNANKHC